MCPDIWEKSCHPAYVYPKTTELICPKAVLSTLGKHNPIVCGAKQTINLARADDRGYRGQQQRNDKLPFFTVLMTPGCCIVCPARRRAASNIADEKASLMMQLWWQMRRQRQKNAEIHLSELAPLIIEERSHFDGDFMPRRGRKFAWLNEVFDLKQKAFSHASPVFSYCSGSSAFDKFV